MTLSQRRDKIGMGIAQPWTTNTPWPGDSSGIYALVIELLGKVLQAPVSETDSTITHALGRMGEAAGVDRAYVFIDRDGTFWDNSHEWCAPGIQPMIEELQGLPRDIVGHWIGQLERGESVHVVDVDALPDGASEKEILQMQDIRTVLVAPILHDGKLAGFVGYDCVREVRRFQAHEISLLLAVSGAISSLMYRRTSYQAEERARQELEVTLQVLPDLILYIDEDGRYVECYSARADLLVQPENVLIGRSLEDVLPPDVAAQQREAMAEARQSGRSKPCRYRLVTMNGREGWYEGTAARRPAAFDGDAPGYVFVIRDVTAETNRNNQLLVLEEVVRLMTNLVVVVDKNERIVWANPAFEARSGYSLGELVGRNPADFTRSPDSDPKAIAQVSQALRDIKPCRVEIENLDRHGNRYWIDMNLHPLTNAQGEHIGFVSVENDITERRAQAMRLTDLARQSEEARAQLLTAIDALPDAFVYFDAEDRLTLFNHRYAEFFPGLADVLKHGAKFEDVLRTGLQRGLYRDAIGREEEWVAEKLLQHRAESSLHEMHLSDGRWLRVLERATPEGGRVGMRVDITALKKVERRLEDIIEAADAGTWEWDVTTGHNKINARWASILGYEPQEVEPVTITFWEKLIHPDDGAQVRKEIERVFRRETEQFTHEFRMRHKLGHWVNVLSRGRVSRWGPDGRALEMVGVHIDVSALKLAEQRLEEIIQGASVGTWEYLSDTHTNRINTLWAEMLGYKHEELIQNPDYWQELLHPEDMQKLDRMHSERLDLGVDQFENEIRLRHKDGHWVWILSRGRVTQRDTAGKVRATAGIHIDITEAKTREEALRRAYNDLHEAMTERDAARQRFADIAAVSMDWFWESDEHHRFTFLSDSIQKATGINPKPLLGRTLHQLASRSPEMLESADWPGLAETLYTHRPLVDFVYLIPWEESRIWVRASGTPYYGPDGAFLGYRGVCSDITQLYVAKERAEAASRAKSQFLANMSHEIRTPLNGVLGMAELLSDALVDPVHRQMIATIRESGEGLLNVLNDILDLAKVEAGKLDLELRSFSPAELAAKVEALYSLRAQEKGLSFAVMAEKGAERPRIGDPHRILQVLHNLISNAIKFTHQGEISVCLRAPAGAPLEIEVKDTGIGMTADQTERVFDDFEQADGATSRRYGGTGLGLSIVRRLVELMGGTIDIDSAPGVGTTIRLRIQCSETTLQAEPPALQPEDKEESFPGLRVLVADDNATNRMILRAMLGALGMTITCVEDGHKAVAAVRGSTFDLLMLDISMPGLDGVATLGEIRALGCGRPAIAVTANAMKHQIDGYFSAGFDGYVGKPFRRDDLAREIARVRKARALSALN